MEFLNLPGFSMQRGKKLMLFVCAFSLFFLQADFLAAQAKASPAPGPFWNLPQDLNDHNLSVRFEVDSTWHLVEGEAPLVSGKVWLENPKDFRSVRGEIAVPVANFDTQNSRRDRRLREAMQADKFPMVSFRLELADGLCDPQIIKDGYVCDCRMHGVLKIRDVEKIIDWPSKITYDEQQSAYILEGNTKVQWQEFGVEDPSIIIAKVDPTAAIKFILVLRAQSPKA